MTGENPNVSGNQHTVDRFSFPNCLSKYRMPYRSWRIKDSPHGMLVSGSTHMPPKGSHWPEATFAVIASSNAGS